VCVLVRVCVCVCNRELVYVCERARTFLLNYMQHYDVVVVVVCLWVCACERACV